MEWFTFVGVIVAVFLATGLLGLFTALSTGDRDLLDMTFFMAWIYSGLALSVVIMKLMENSFM